MLSKERLLRLMRLHKTLSDSHCRLTETAFRMRLNSRRRHYRFGRRTSIDFSNPNNLQQKKIVGPSSLSDAGFAEAVSLNGNYAIVGQDSDPTEIPFGGSAHLYDVSNLNAIVEKRLIPTDAPNYSAFGRRVSISDEGASQRGLCSRTNCPAHLMVPFGRSTSVIGTASSNSNLVDRQYLTIQARLAAGSNCKTIWPLWVGLTRMTSAQYIFTTYPMFLRCSNSLRLPVVPGDSASGISLAIDEQMLLVSDREGQVYLYRLIPEPTAFTLFVAAMLVVIRSRIRSR